MRSGSTPVVLQTHQVTMATAISVAPWATLTMCITPNTSVRPDAIRAYTPPMSSPRTIACSSWSMVNRILSCRPSGSVPAGLGVDHFLRGRGLGRPDDLDLAALPLCQQEVVLRSTRLVPAERSQDCGGLVAVQPVGDLGLVEAADLLHRLLQDLGRGERIRGVLGRGLVVELGGVGLHELVVLRGLGLLVPAHGVEHALGVRLADAVAVLAGVAGRGGLEQQLRRVADLLE